MDDMGHVWVLWLGRGTVRGHVEVAWDLIDGELPLEAAAHPAVQGDFHGVVDVAHFVPAHLILDVEPNHCGRQGEKRHQHPERRAAPSSRDPSSIYTTAQAGRPLQELMVWVPEPQRGGESGPGIRGSQPPAAGKSWEGSSQWGQRSRTAGCRGDYSACCKVAGRQQRVRVKRLPESWPCLSPAVQPAVAEALNLLMPQFPSLKNEVIRIKPSLEHHEDQRVNMCGKCLAPGLMHRNWQVLNVDSDCISDSLWVHNRLRRSFIHSFIHPCPFIHAFLYHCPVLRALPSGSLGTFRGSSVH